MKTEHPERKFGLIGPVGLEEYVFKLSHADLLELLGPAATSAGPSQLRMENVRDLVDSLMNGVSSPPPASAAIAPVPTNKLPNSNKLPHHWCGLITAAAPQNGG